MSSPVLERTAVFLADLGDEKRRLLQSLVEGLGPAELSWLSGFLAGLAAGTSRQPPEAAARGAPGATLDPAVTSPAQAPRLTIVYGTQTGHSRAIAERLETQAQRLGLQAAVVRASDYPARALKDERLLAVVISTQGDGEPPDDARALYQLLTGPRAPKLAHVSFAVLGLGDSSYPKFCHVGRALDERLAQLGARRLVPRVDCDVDFESSADAWAVAVARAVADAVSVGPSSDVVAEAAPLAAFSRARPFAAPVLACQRITARQATKSVLHVELSIEGSALRYQPGDALGMWPENPPWLVAEVLAATGLSASTIVRRDGVEQPLERWLALDLELTKLSRPFLTKHAERSRDAALEAALGDQTGEALRALFDSQQLLDVLLRAPAPWTAEDFVHALRRLTPRLYSIASSQRRTPDEVHLTVAHVAYDVGGQRRVGSASDHVARSRPGVDSLRIFTEPNERFRLPTDASRDVIMIGPGTGVAPFRAFVQERAETGARGRNWLFFGEQHARTQFLYQLEWQQALKDGALHRLDPAFSRDQPERIYVQQRLRERGKDVYDWLESGAHLYVCGNANRMAPDVEQALRSVAELHGGHTQESAAAWLESLREAQRYARDVY